MTVQEIREIIRQMLDDWNKATPRKRMAAIEAAEEAGVEYHTADTALIATYLEGNE
jgi:hypothetical protein